MTHLSPIHSLGYIGINSSKLSEWTDFATHLLGMQQVDKGGKQNTFETYRMDTFEQRLVVSNESADSGPAPRTLAFIGWQVKDREALDLLANRIEQAGIRVSTASSELRQRRYVRDLVHFEDPDGNRIELFVEPLLSRETFVPGRPISGFKTGSYGMGHAVLHSSNVDKMIAFYRDVLGFAVSDFGLSPYPMYFFHVNGRHHSFALLGTGQLGFHHFMVEFDHLDDVGQGYDIASQHPESIAYTLGRHTNDHMTSYYAISPSEFFVESGWGGRIIDPNSWVAEQTFDGPSFWGHDRPYLPEESRNAFRDLRMQAANKGIRAPAIADCPWLYQQIDKQR